MLACLKINLVPQTFICSNPMQNGRKVNAYRAAGNVHYSVIAADFSGAKKQISLLIKAH